MRNGSQIIADSFKLHDGVIEKGTIISFTKEIKAKTVPIRSQLVYENEGKQIACPLLLSDALQPNKELTNAR